MSTEPTEPTDTNYSQWSNHALLKGLPKDDGLLSVLSQMAFDCAIAVRFQQTIESAPVYVIATDGGYWGRGATVKEAAQKVMENGSARTHRAFLWVVLNDPKPCVDNFGAVNCASVGHIISVGFVGTIGGILNANKEGK